MANSALRTKFASSFWKSALQTGGTRIIRANKQITRELACRPACVTRRQPGAPWYGGRKGQERHQGEMGQRAHKLLSRRRSAQRSVKRAARTLKGLSNTVYPPL